jgi:hypothetical protein
VKPICVFSGPTLFAADALPEVDITYLPPASQGDIYRIAQKHPLMIGIVDGYFERVPAVWHKEILWAMTQGIHVFGSAGIGALRAAELTPFGMEGVGKIFEQFRDGVLEDDDEVALIHSCAEANYRPASEAMVNIRYVLAKAEALAVLKPSSRVIVERIAKELFYPQRTYPHVVQLAAKQGVALSELKHFMRWLPRGRVEQMRDDAVLMLEVMQTRLADLKPKHVSFALARIIHKRLRRP